MIIPKYQVQVNIPGILGYTCLFSENFENALNTTLLPFDLDWDDLSFGDYYYDEEMNEYVDFSLNIVVDDLKVATDIDAALTALVTKFVGKSTDTQKNSSKKN